jgi:predicted GH43/DUF377 family glycosyl hydrolase
MTAVSRQCVLKPRPLWWEANGVFNPGAVELNGKIHLLYRAVGRDHISRFGLAVSDDGLNFQPVGDRPIFEGADHGGWERLGVEDPRITVLDRKMYVTYTAASVYPALADQKSIAASLNTPGVPWRIRPMLLTTPDLRHFDYVGNGPIIADLDTKDSILFPAQINRRYWLIHRLLPSIYVSQSNRLDRFDGGIQIMAPLEPWEVQRIGAACPPIPVEQGWLLLYHGVSREGEYALGAALLALNNPARVLARTKQPLLRPKTAWEKKGVINNVIFVTGCIVRGDQLWLYYGGGDRVIGRAVLPIATVMNQLTYLS